MLGAEAGDYFGEALCEVGVIAVSRFEIRLELLANLGRGCEVLETYYDALRVFGDIALVLILELDFEEKILVAVSLALGRIAVALL